jgi:hypothetical protein
MTQGLKSVILAGGMRRSARSDPHHSPCVAVLVAWVALAVGPSSGCEPCRPSPTVHFSEDFEECEPLCGWSVTGGEGRLVTTIHPTEHALSLTIKDAEVVAERAVDVAIGGEDPVEVRLLSECPALALEVELVWEGSPESRLDLQGAGGASDSPFRALYGLGDPAPGAPLSAIRITASRSCTVDRLLVSTRRLGGGGC